MTRRRAKRRRRPRTNPVVIEIEAALDEEARARGRLVLEQFIDRFVRIAFEQFTPFTLFEHMRPVRPARPPWCDVLGVPPTATADEIEAAYRRLAMANHPDRGGDGARMAAINAARDAALQQHRESYA